MLSQEIRRRFLNYFKEKGHAVVPSSPVVPHDDPTLLFNNAGMNQFKDVFLGKNQRDYKRAATAQKCLRVGGKHNDLDNVGHTSRHLTFFEMLGNFSFGDYFKEQAIKYAWDVSTNVFGFAPEQLWITIFETDDEAFAMWEKIIPQHRIVRLGEKDNFWAMGETGPCGPCSELYFDRGEQFGSARSPKEDVSGERYLEFWNLVFMQYNRDVTGKLTPLPQQSIDTGAGLERVISLKMGVDSLFGTDILRALIARVEEVSGKPYDQSKTESAPAFHVIADHIRSLAFAIADGAQPSNVERGYVLRKLLRRAVRYGRSLGMNEPFLAKILPRLIEIMGPDYPELSVASQRISELLTIEEENFLRTLKRGGNILNNIVEKAQSSASKQINGDDAFKLKDTYGLPIEEVLLIAKDSGLAVDTEAYLMLEEQAKEKSRAAKEVHAQEVEQSVYKDCVEKNGPSAFVGYTNLEAEGFITALIVNGKCVNSIDAGTEAIVLLSKTPFYAEKGGQVGDSGKITHQEALFTVYDCKAPYPDVFAHIGKLEQGSLVIGEPVRAFVDKVKREAITHYHTATHLLHWALQQVAGGHIKQAGSLVEPARLRFDFNHHKPLSLEEIRRIEEMVNQKVREDSPVATYEIPYEEAQQHSDIKQFFGEKYGSKVRVVDIDFSKELCGGTHVTHLGVIGLVRITKESSIAAGVRRIEAVTGKEAEQMIYQNESLALAAAEKLKTPLAKLPEKIDALLEENKQLATQLKNARRTLLKQMTLELQAKVQTIKGIPLLAALADVQADELLTLSEDLMIALHSAVIVLASKENDKCQLLIKVSPDLIKKGVQAQALIKEIAPIVGGGGGGKAESAQAGGKLPDKLPLALDAARLFLERLFE